MPSEIVNLRRFQWQLDRLQAKMESLDPFFLKVSVILDQAVQRNFESDGSDFQAGGWPALKPITYGGKTYTGARLKYPKMAAETKAAMIIDWTFGLGGAGKRGRPLFGKVEQNAKILRDTGKGRASIVASHWDRGAKVETSGGNFVYMAAHHMGKGHLPERKVIPAYHDVKPKILKLIEWQIKVLTGKAQ